MTGTTTNPTLDFGFAGRYAVGNRVWFDTDNNGVKNDGEAGVGGVTVQLFAAGSLGGASAFPWVRLLRTVKVIICLIIFFQANMWLSSPPATSADWVNLQAIGLG